MHIQYSYVPYGIESISDKNGISTYYEYDDWGRLKVIKDGNTDILKQFNYHVAGNNKEFLISTKANEGGKISESTLVKYNENKTIYITPKWNYIIKDVVVK